MKLEFKTDHKGNLFLDGVEVQIVECFPWEHPGEFISLVDDDHKEVKFIRSLDELDKAQRAIVKNHLKAKNFSFEISQIENINEEYEVRHYEVQTSQGERSFQTKLEDWPVQLNTGEVLIQSLEGDLYKVRDFEKLSKKSQKAFAPYVK